MHPVIFKNVNKEYEGKFVLQEINIEIEHNKITVIIGRSGSGKSTILKIINGLIRPSGGEVLVFEKKIDYAEINELDCK